MSESAYNSAQAVRRARALLYEKWQPRGEPLIVTRGPGRLNLIGEHTDYNQGYVLPVAVDRAVVVAAAPREDGRVRVWSESLDSGAEYNLGREQEQRFTGWVQYLQGVSWVLGELGKEVRGLDAVIFSDVPRGAGLSSSAALEVAWALALLTGAGEHLPPRELALACQRAENEYVGMHCGILDQFASVFGRAQAALLVDCESLEMQVVPMKGQPVSLVVCDTNKPRALVDSEYNQRRASCEEAARLLGVPSLRHANQEMVMTARERLGEVNFKRAWHVISENERVLETAEALKRGDLEAVGRMISASHRSLRDYYEVSCPELEEMWTATQRAGCYGSRLVGAGFGGAVMAMVAEEEVRQFIPKVTQAYQQATHRQPNVFAVQIANGAEVVLP
jgi:galactokinase